jgi:hypothetical protein
MFQCIRVVFDTVESVNGVAARCASGDKSARPGIVNTQIPLCGVVQDLTRERQTWRFRDDY